MLFSRLIAAVAVLACAPAAFAYDIILRQPIMPQPSMPLVPVALLVDLSTGQTLFARNADHAFIPASMTKAMSALVAFDLIAAGKLDEKALVTVDPELAQRWSGKGTTLSLRAGEQVAVRDLLAGMITVSANDATEVLARHTLGSREAWIAAMNARAAALGMTGSRFASPTGWPDGGRTRVTARDMVLLGKALIEQHPSLYHRYFGRAAMNWRGGSLASRNPFAGRAVGADGVKTGHTREAGYNFLGSAERDGRRLMLVVSGASSEAVRAKAATNLLEWGYRDWGSRPLLAKGQTVGTVQVQDGAQRRLAVAPTRAWKLAVPKGHDRRIVTLIMYRGPLRAPIKQGAVVADLAVIIDGQQPHEIPLVAQHSVARAGPFDRMVNGLLGLLP